MSDEYGRHTIMCPNCEGTGKIISNMTDWELTPLELDCGICYGCGYIMEDVNDDKLANWEEKHRK